MKTQEKNKQYERLNQLTGYIESKKGSVRTFHPPRTKMYILKENH